MDDMTYRARSILLRRLNAPTMALLLLLALSSCDLFFPHKPDRGSGGSLTLVLEARGSAASRTVLPSIDMTPFEYRILGTGPTGSAPMDEKTSATSFSKDGLALGDWAVTAIALNSGGEEIGAGSTTVHIVSGENAQAEIFIAPLVGTGSATVSLSWPAGLVAAPSIAASIVHPDSASEGLAFTMGGDGCSATWENASLATGYHTISIALLDGASEVMWVEESLRIVKDQPTPMIRAFSAQEVQKHVSRPRMDLAAGTYSGAQVVTLTCPTPGALIIYTNNGSTPTLENGIQYSGPITISSTQTLKAAAWLDDWSGSSVATSPYVITNSMAIPSFSPQPGVYYDSIFITLGCPSSESTIFYTTDGNAPDPGTALVYSSRFSLSNSSADPAGAGFMIRALSVDSGASGRSRSDETSAIFLVTGTVASPSFFPASATSDVPIEVAISSATSGASIRYTTDGSDPTPDLGTVYTIPIPLSSTTNLKAVAYKQFWKASSVVSKAYTLKVKTPALSVTPGTYNQEKSVALSCDTVGATIYYSLTGADPVSGGAVYVEGSPILIDQTRTLRVAAAKAGLANSDTVTASYVLKVKIPTFAYSPGAFIDSLELGISTATTGTTSIVYTLDGSTPSSTHGTTGATATLTDTATVKAIARRSGWTDSDLAQATYRKGADPLPSDGSFYQVGVALDWADMAGAEAYRLQASGDTGFSGGVFADAADLAVSEYAMPSPPALGSDFYWRIQVKRGGAWGAWGPAWKATVRNFWGEVLNSTAGISEGLFNSIALIPGGGYLAIGSIWDTAATNNDAWAVRLDEAGQIVWQKSIGGPLHETFTSAVCLADGGFLAVGHTQGLGATGWDAWVVKLSADGAIAWQERFGGSGDDKLEKVLPCPDGNYLAVGHTKSFGASGDDGWVVKLSPEGGLLWQQRLGGSLDDTLATGVATADGGFVVGGFSNSFGGSGNDGWLVKLNSDGYITWQKQIGWTDNDYISMIAATSDGGYIASGNTKGTGVAATEGWVMKLDAVGAIEWQRTYGSAGDDFLYICGQLKTGKYFAAGYTTSFAAPAGDVWVLQLEADGSIARQERFGTPTADIILSVGEKADGTFIAAGMLMFSATSSSAFAFTASQDFQTAASAEVNATTAIPTASTGASLSTSVSAVSTTATAMTTNAGSSDSECIVYSGGY